jgi:hypothetical protein
MDKPYNLLPSLHIALCTILADLYARHTRGLLHQASNFWFVLIGLSAVLTYQHHVMDVVAGFALGAYCLYFFPGFNARAPVTPNQRIGGYYLIGMLLLATLAALFWPWGAFLIWPGVSIGLTAAAYFGLGPGIYRKREGRLPWTTRWALGAVLLGQEISRRYYRRQCEAWSELTPRVWIGGVASHREACDAIGKGVTAVLDLTAEFCERVPFRSVTYRNIPVIDLTAPTPDQLEQMATFIGAESERGIVFVHCKIGYSRTAAAAAAYLLRTKQAGSVAEAIAWLRRVRPAMVIRPEIIDALENFGKEVSPRA